MGCDAIPPGSIQSVAQRRERASRGKDWTPHFARQRPGTPGMIPVLVGEHYAHDPTQVDAYPLGSLHQRAHTEPGIEQERTPAGGDYERVAAAPGSQNRQLHRCVAVR